MSGSDTPRIISVDDHIVEPPHLFERWVTSKYRDRAPKVVRRGFGSFEFSGFAPRVEFDDESNSQGDCWVFEDHFVVHKRAHAAAGFPRDDMGYVPITYDEMRPGCFDPTARLADMDLNWVEASLCFPTFPRFCGQTFLDTADKDLALACLVAYNDWIVDEWCGGSGGRLVPLCLVPLWSVDLAVAELVRNARRGVRNVTFPEIPAKLGLPSIHTGDWDPLFAACQANDVAVHMHIGSSSQMPLTSRDAPAAVAATLTFNNAMASLSDYLFSGLLVRYPELRLAYSEGQIGWIPYILERADDVWRECRAYAQVAHIPEPPSTYYYRNVFGCFFRDRFGLESLRHIGVDNVTFETDYPHTDTTWPDSKQVAETLTAGLDSDVRWKILRGNAIRLLRLDLDR